MIKKTLAALALSTLALTSMAASFVEGKDYVKLATPVAVADPSKIEVLEFFWYNCPHCYRLQAPLDAWLEKAPADVAYRAAPAVLSARWGILARAYFAQAAIGPVDRKLHAAIFKAIHEQKQDLEKPENLYKVVEAVKGKEYRNKFEAANTSFGVNMKLSQAQKMSLDYQLEGTPTVVVDGAYAVSPSTAGSEAGMMPIVDYLVKMQRAKRAKK